MPTAETPLSPLLRRRLQKWFQLWDTPSLSDSLRVEISPRLKRAFGRCYLQDRIIRLTPSLFDSQSYLLEEILCHEAAHAAVYQRHGASAKPHGSQWEEMMRSAGFEPRVRIPVVVGAESPVMTTANYPVVYQHHCPVCDLSRPAAKPMRGWRCRACVGGRTKGRLVIRRELSNRGTQREKTGAARSQPRRFAASNSAKQPARGTVKGSRKTARAAGPGS